MRFAALVALAVVASIVPSFAAPTPYFHRRVTSERDTAVLDDFVHPRIGTVVLPGANPSLNSKRDSTSDIVQAIDAALNELPPARKRDITADIAAALQTLVQEGSSVLSDINLKREADSALPIEERSFTIPETASSWINDIGNIISLGVGADKIVDAFSNSTRRDLDQTLDGDDDGEALDGAALQFEDRSFTIPSDVSSILGKVAGVVSAAGTVATIVSDFDGSSNSTKRELSMDSGRDTVHDQRRAVSSDIESILQQIISSVEGAVDGTSTSTSTKRSTNDDGLADTITPEQLDELSYYA